MHGEHYPVILGVYSLRQDEAALAVWASSHQPRVTYWYARKIDDRMCDVQPLNVHHVPSGVRKLLEEGELRRLYTPEPLYYRTHTVPALASLYRKLAEGEASLSELRLDDAERAFIKALMIDDLNVPASYGLGEIYAERQDVARLRRVLHVLMGNGEAFHVEHAPRFNRFGISLRRNGFLDDSLSFYFKALEWREDAHLHFNIARACFDKGDRAACIRHLNRSLAMQPDFAEARQFLDFCNAHP